VRRPRASPDGPRQLAIAAVDAGARVGVGGRAVAAGNPLQRLLRRLAL